MNFKKKNKKMNISDILEKITLPIAIIIGSAFLAIAFYLVQVDKRESIEKQQRAKDLKETLQKAEENKRADLKLKQDECESLSVGVRAKWNNVMGVTYDDKIWKECVATYTDTETGEVETSPLRFMQDTSY